MRTGLLCLILAAICAIPAVTASGKGADNQEPKMSVAMPDSLKLKTFLSDGLAYDATVNEPVGYVAALFVSKKTARKWDIADKTVTIAEGFFQVKRAGTFPHALTELKRKKKLRRLLRNPDFKRLPTVFLANAVDGAGNETLVRKKVGLTK